MKKILILTCQFYIPILFTLLNFEGFLMQFRLDIHNFLFKVTFECKKCIIFALFMLFLISALVIVISFLTAINKKNVSENPNKKFSDMHIN